MGVKLGLGFVNLGEIVINYFVYREFLVKVGFSQMAIPCGDYQA